MLNHVQNAVKAALQNSPFHPEMTEQQLADTLDNFWSLIAVQVKSTLKDAQLQGVYAVLFSQVRLESNRAGWQDEPVIYTRVLNRNVRKDVASLLLVIAALLMLLTSYLLNGKKYHLGMILCGLSLLLVVASLALQLIKGETATHKVEQRLRPQAIHKALEATATALDSNAETLLSLVTPISDNSELQALSLVREIYRASAHENGNVRTALQEYLRQNSVKEVDYTTENASLFDVMPSNGTKTIQPALVQETATGTHLISKGLACIQMK